MNLHVVQLRDAFDARGRRPPAPLVAAGAAPPSPPAPTGLVWLCVVLWALGWVLYYL